MRNKSHKASHRTLRAIARAWTLHISRKNKKTNDTPSVSTSPGATCGKNVPCRRFCYACKMARLRPSVAASWQRNAAIWQRSPHEYFAAIRAYLSLNAPPLFRWHVAGDIPTQAYLDTMKEIAREFPGTLFLAFTKAHHLDFARLPQNLSIVASLWPGWGNADAIRRKGLPIAWMQDGSETRVPASAVPCSGSCATCNDCWHLKLIRRDVVFKKH